MTLPACRLIRALKTVISAFVSGAATSGVADRKGWLSMRDEELRAELEKHLDTLRRNLEVASLSVLKTKYRKPYEALCQDICKAGSAYTKQIVLRDFRMRKECFPLALPIIQSAIQQSGLLKQISIAAFRNQNIQEIEELAIQLRNHIQTALEPFYTPYLYLYVTEECFNDPPQKPEIYNYATGCILTDGAWVPFDDAA